MRRVSDPVRSASQARRLSPARSAITPAGLWRPARRPQSQRPTTARMTAFRPSSGRPRSVSRHAYVLPPPWLLPQEDAAVGPDLRSGQVAGHTRSQEHRDGVGVVRMTRVAQWNALIDSASEDVESCRRRLVVTGRDRGTEVVAA
jgi:hypothetical protein